MSNLAALQPALVKALGFLRKPYVIASCAGVLVIAAVLAQTSDAPPVMTVPGQFGVGPTGAASYSVPITVPPGTAGMVPALALGYSSQSSDGLAGLGWSLGGLSSITRCPRTLAQDSVHGSVNYDSNDRFCLDGQRLVVISGTYGANGSEYRTEIESFTKVVAHGTAGAGPVWFQVWTKAGQIMEFGNSTDSRVVYVDATTDAPSASGTISVWGVNKISDVVGNYLTVTYNCTPVANACTNTDRTSYGQIYPLQIDYTGNSSAGVSPYNSVQFTYTTRTDVSSLYQAGGITKTTVLLEHVKTYQGANLVFDYQLAYRAGTTTKRSRLTSLTLCDGASHCLPATTFEWQGGTGTFEVSTTGSAPSSAWTVYPGDWNADGLTDYATAPAITYTCPPYSVWVGQQNFTFASSAYTLTNGASVAASCIIERPFQTILGPNGASDVLMTVWGFNGGVPGGNKYYYSMLTTAGNINLMSASSSLSGGSLTNVFAGDFNGDGITDYFEQGSPSYYFYGTTGGSFTPSSGFSGLAGFQATDFDGDGCTDLWGVQSGTPTVKFSCNSAVSSVGPPSVTADRTTLGDFNGDGKTDILYTRDGSAGELWLSTGKGFLQVNTSITANWVVQGIGDWDGDGRADVVIGSPASSLSLFLSTGTGFTAAKDPNGTDIVLANSYAAAAVVADWNNDGATDILVQDPDPVVDGVFNTPSYSPELMTSVTTGIGAKTYISYDRINKNGSFYTKGTSATYPIQDIDGPQYVVSRVDTSNGLGTCAPSSSYDNCFSSTYTYATAQKNLQGRGFLGFGQVAVKNLQTNAVQTTNYSLTFPYIGLVSSQTAVRTPNTNPLSAVTNTLASNSGCGGGVSPPSGVTFVCTAESLATGYDLDDTSVLPQTTTEYTYDNYGNALTVDVEVEYVPTGATSTKATTNTYTNDTSNWFLGRLETIKVVSDVAGSPSLSRCSSFDYSSTTGLLTQEVIEPSGSACIPGTSTYTLTTDYTYDAFGHRITTHVTGTGVDRFSRGKWDSLGQFQIQATNALDQSEFWTYDSKFGKPVSQTGPNGLTTTWAYDGFGRPTSETRPDGTKTLTTYAYCAGVNGGSALCPSHGAFLAEATPVASDGTTQIGSIGKAYYDVMQRSIGTDTQGFDGNAIRVTTQFDAKGWVHTTSRPYFASGPPAAITTFTRDDLGRVTQAAMPDGSVTNYCYAGLKAWVRNHLGQTTETINNLDGLKASVTTGTFACGTDGSGSNPTTHYVYDSYGNLDTVTDPTGSNEIDNDYDIRGNNISMDDPDMGDWSYEYNALGELTKQTDAKGNVTNITYDALGRAITRDELVASTSTFYSTWTYGASAADHNIGQLAETKSCTSSSCSTVISSRKLVYDSLGRPSTSVIKVDSESYGYVTRYNATTGRVASATYPSGLQVNYAYNSFGHLCLVAENAGSPTCAGGGGSHVLWTGIARDAELHLTTAMTANGVVTNQSFNVLTGRPEALRAGPSAGTTGSVASFDYAFDVLGNLTQRKDNTQSLTENFCYDDLNRLVGSKIGSACSSSPTKTVAYNSIGNITLKSDVCNTTNCYTYPSAGGARPHAVTAITGTVNGITNPKYNYDANGNLDCVYTGGSVPSNCSGGGTQRKITLTVFNMADTITAGSTSIAFAYDSAHQRIKQATTVSGTTTTTVYLNDSASGAMSQKVTVGSGTPSFVDYITMDGQIIAQRTAQFDTANAWGTGIWNTMPWDRTVNTASDWNNHNWNSFNWATAASSISWNYFILDHLGSIAVVTNDAGAVLSTGGRLSYDAWGRQRNADGTDASCGSISRSTTRGFTNQEQVPLDCIVNLNARLYDPTIGKFQAPDSIVPSSSDAQSYNRYAYVVNNPLSLADPTGNSFYSPFNADSGVPFIDGGFGSDPRQGGGGYGHDIVMIYDIGGTTTTVLLPSSYAESPSGEGGTSTPASAPAPGERNAADLDAPQNSIGELTQASANAVGDASETKVVSGTRSKDGNPSGGAIFESPAISDGCEGCYQVAYLDRVANAASAVGAACAKNRPCSNAAAAASSVVAAALAAAVSSIRGTRDGQNYVVRVQVQGIGLKKEGYASLAQDTPVRVGQVHDKLTSLAQGLTKSEQSIMRPAFIEASQWASKIAAAGGIGPIGSRSFYTGIDGPQSFYRVDIDVVSGPVNIVPGGR